MVDSITIGQVNNVKIEWEKPAINRKDLVVKLRVSATDKRLKSIYDKQEEMFDKAYAGTCVEQPDKHYIGKVISLKEKNSLPYELNEVKSQKFVIIGWDLNDDLYPVHLQMVRHKNFTVKVSPNDIDTIVNVI
jgi:hypothetical protein